MHGDVCAARSMWTPAITSKHTSTYCRMDNMIQRFVTRGAAVNTDLGLF